MTFNSSTAAVTAPRIPYIPDIPKLSTSRLSFANDNSDQFTNLKFLYRSVLALDQLIGPMEDNIDSILSQLSPEQQSSLSGNIAALQELGADAKANADQKFSDQVSLLGLWHVYNDTRYPTEIQKLAVLGYVISGMHSDAARELWEEEYGAARLQEIKIKQHLLDAYRELIPALNTAYLSKFYPDYALFPERSRAGASKAIEQIGAFNFSEGFLDNKVEILISDVRLASLGSQFGHVAINIGGVVYGRAPTTWDIRGKEKFLTDQEASRSTIGYVIQLDEIGKRKLFQSVINKIITDAKYSLIDHSCSGEIISSFAELGINIVDPRWTVGDIYAPADIDNFLKHSEQVVKINLYPKI